MFDDSHSAGTSRWPVVRLRAGSKTRIVLLSTRFLPLPTHWVKPTVPCPGEYCRLCELLPVRTLYYVACQNDGRVSLLELGGTSFANFEQHAKLFSGGMIPGTVFDVSRRTAQSPTYSEAVDKKEGVKEIDLMDLVAHVMALYRYPCPNPGEILAEYERRIMLMAQLRNKRLFEQQSLAKK